MRIAVLIMLLVSLAAAGQPNALVCTGVASLRSEPRHSAELETQALMGTPLRLDSLSADGEWWLAQLPDGYRAWIPASSVTDPDEMRLQRWRTNSRLICVNDTETRIYSRPTTDSEPVSDMTAGCIVEGDYSPLYDWTAVTLPDGRRGFAATPTVIKLAEKLEQHPDTASVLQTARDLNGVSYLWGGNTTKALDCSGMTQLAYRNAGLLLPRNASQQALIGEPIAVDTASLQAGDLLFFTNERGRVIHVGIYESCGLYRHCSGRVHQSSMLPGHPLYNGRAVTSARRIIGTKTSEKALIRSHPWYFTDVWQR